MQKGIFMDSSFSFEEVIWTLLWSFCWFGYVILSYLVGKLFSLQDMLWLIFRARTYPIGHSRPIPNNTLSPRQALIYNGFCTAKESFGLVNIIFTGSQLWKMSRQSFYFYRFKKSLYLHSKQNRSSSWLHVETSDKGEEGATIPFYLCKASDNFMLLK